MNKLQNVNWYLVKRLRFTILNAKNGHFSRYCTPLRHFPIFISFHFGRPKSVSGHFRILYEISFKVFIAPRKPKIYIFTSLDLVTSDYLDFTPDQQRILSILRSVPGTIHDTLSALFQLDMATMPDEASDDSTKSYHWPYLWLLEKMQTFGKFMPGDVKCPFQVEN